MSGVPYHAWTHRPKSLGGTDPIAMPLPSWFRGYDTVGFTRTSGGSQSIPLYDEWQCSNTTVFTPLDATLAEASPGEAVRRVQLNSPGWYSLFFGVLADVNADGSVELAMHDGDDTWGAQDAVNHAVDSSYTTGFLTFTLTRIYPIFDPAGNPNDTPQINFTVAQTTGVNLVCGPAWMEIHYLPADTAVVAS